MVRAGLGYLAAADAAQLPSATQAECLRELERDAAVLTAARAGILASFTAGQGYADDADYSTARHLQAHRRHAPRAHLRQAGHLLPRPAGHRAQSDGAVPRAAAASARAAWALTRRPIHQNSTPTTMKHSTGVSSVHR